MPLTPSFVGSNPATPATDTIYCIRNVLPNTIYGFCFMWLLSLFPKLGKEMGKLFGLNFVFLPRFSACFVRICGLFCFTFAFSKNWFGETFVSKLPFRLLLAEIPPSSACKRWR